MKRIYFEVGLLTVGLITYFVGGLYLIHKMDMALQAFLVGTGK